MSKDTKTSGGGMGCLGALAMVAFVALAGWAFLDYTPKEAVIFGFEVWAGLVCFLLSVVMGFFGLAAIAGALAPRPRF